jgi:hypothetical protein
MAQVPNGGTAEGRTCNIAPAKHRKSQTSPKAKHRKPTSRSQTSRSQTREAKHRTCRTPAALLGVSAVRLLRPQALALWLALACVFGFCAVASALFGSALFGFCAVS